MTITKEQVADLFMHQIDCGSVVAGEFAEETGVDQATLRKAAGAFGGGMFAGETCGAFAAAAVVIGLKYGISELDDEEQKGKMMEKYFTFAGKMHEKYPSFLCRDLLGCSVPEAAESGKMMEFCPALCEEVVACLKDVLSEQE